MTPEIIFLFVLALIWILFATVQDLRMREVANWLNFSLIIFAIGFRFFFALFYNSWQFLLQGIFGLAIFFVLAQGFYYLRVFSGGDAKLLLAMGAILPATNSLYSNLQIFIVFLFLLFLVGGIYGILGSFWLAGAHFKEFKSDFKKRIRRKKHLIYIGAVFSILFLFFGYFIDSVFYYSFLLALLLPFLYLYARSVDEKCMIQKRKKEELREGDWIAEKIRIGKVIIKERWEGLSRKEIRLIQTKYPKRIVYVKQGIPFVPVFLVAFLLLIYLLLF